MTITDSGSVIVEVIWINSRMPSTPSFIVIAAAESQFGKGDSVGMTTLWVCVLAVIAIIHVVCRSWQTEHNFSRARVTGRVLFWMAFPIATIGLAGGLLAFMLKINIGLFLLSLAALEIGIWASLVTTLSIAIELLSTTRPDVMRCWLGVFVAVAAMAISLSFGMPV